MTGWAHICHTSDGVPISIGLRVRDYDNKIGTITRAPDVYELSATTCWPAPGHNGHWWGVTREDGTFSTFDGSRLTTKQLDGTPIGQAS